MFMNSDAASYRHHGSTIKNNNVKIWSLPFTSLTRSLKPHLRAHPFSFAISRTGEVKQRHTVELVGVSVIEKVVEHSPLRRSGHTMSIQPQVAVQARTAPEIPPFTIERLVQVYLSPDNAVLATKRITENLTLMFHYQMTTPNRKKWEGYDKLVIPVPGISGRYRLYGRGFYKDEGIEISWTSAQEQLIAQTLGYGDTPPWNDMPTKLPRILYPPGRFTEKHLRQAREEEHKKQKQVAEAHASRATSIRQTPTLRSAQSTGRLAKKPRPRGVKITGLGWKKNAWRSHVKWRARNKTVTSLS